MKIKTIINQIERWAKKYYGSNWDSDEALGDIKELRKILKNAQKSTTTKK